jgi:ribose-phosphate pyrophosphokinase
LTPLVLPLPGNERLAAALARRLDAEAGTPTLRRFPDGESYVRVTNAIAGRSVVLTCTLDRPDAKLVPLLLLAATVRDLGAARVGLVAPYLPYLRQDDRFAPGEGITSIYFARLLSDAVDWLVTVEPHLHRHRSLADLYTIPATTLQAAPLLAAWIRAHVAEPVLIGPDAESAPWVTAVAAAAGAPSIVLEKVRLGDREVQVTVPDPSACRGRTPVLVDDIVSTGATLRATIAQLARLGMAAPVCVAVHAVFAERAYEELLAARPAAVVSTNTIVHPSNAIAVDDLLADGVRGLLDDRPLDG